MLKESGIDISVIRDVLEYYAGKENENIIEIKKIIEIENKNLGAVENSVLSKVVMGVAKDMKNIVSRMAILLAEGEENQDENTINRFDIYIPIAHKSGLGLFASRFEDLKFKIEKPQEYNLVKAMINKSQEERKEIVEVARKKLKTMCKKNCFVSSRAKHLYGIYRKIMRGYKFKDIHDIYGLRIICDNKEEIYKIVQRISEIFPIKEIEDYYKKPKKSGYKSVHIVADIEGNEFEIQVIEWDVHWENEMGKSAHWIYKNIEKDKGANLDEQLSITKQLIDVFNKEKEKFKFSVLGNDVYAFTPKKDLIVLPNGSSALDFAFSVHSDLGLKAKGIKINGISKPFETIVQSGDIIEIQTGKEIQVNRSWLNLVSTQKAKQKIRSYLKIKGEWKKEKKILSKIDVKKLKIAKCCLPEPEDEIVGCKTTKRKIVVHKIDCEKLKNIPKSKLVDVEFPNIKEFSLLLEICATPSPTTLPIILEIFKKNKASIRQMNVKINKNNVVYRIECIVKNFSFFNYLIEGLNKEKVVQNAKRI